MATEKYPKVDFRVTGKQKQRLKETAHAKGMNVSEYIRSVAVQDLHWQRIQSLLAELREILSKWPVEMWNKTVGESLVDDVLAEVEVKRVAESDGLSIDRMHHHLQDLAAGLGVSLETRFEERPEWAEKFEREALAKNRDPQDLADELAGRKHL